MPQDSITELRVAGLRTLLDIRLRLSPLTVLTGENGSGKSTIIEACEILRRAAHPNFLDHFIEIHGGFEAFRSYGSDRVVLGVRIEGQAEPIEYTFEIQSIAGLAISSERLVMFPTEGQPVEVLSRTGPAGSVLDAEKRTRDNIRPIPGAKLLLNSLGLRAPHPAIDRTTRALAQIDVHLPFSVFPGWIERSIGGTARSMRASSPKSPRDSLERQGLNLASVYDGLIEDKASWHTTMDYIRLGLGDDIKEVSVGKNKNGDLEILFEYARFPARVPASSLSDGTLGYLAFVALYRLAPKKSLVAFDEPEGNLHPVMVTRVAQLLQLMSADRNVLVATHSDRFLDAISTPEDSVVLCSLGRNRETKIVRPDKEALREWLKDYSGFGEIRSAGHEASVMTQNADGDQSR